MRHFALVALFIALAVLALPATVLAHSPLFPENNHSLATAFQVETPSKSWAIYTSLDRPDQADYYRFSLSSGDRIQLSLITPRNPATSGFLPSIALLVPGLTSQVSLPDYVEVPAGYGAIVVNGTDPGHATYEAFSPGWFYQLADLNIDAPRDGTYYVVVFNAASQTDDYGLAVGYVETFTAWEIISIPYDTQVIYSWEGQSPIITLLPLILVLVVGTAVLYWRSRARAAPRGVSQWLAALGGLAFLGSAAGRLYQMVLALSITGWTNEALLTLAIAILAIILGILSLLYAVRTESTLTVRWRISLIVIGLVGLFAWAGLYIGPALVILAAFLPTNREERGSH